jgi:hypothetical protein
VKVCRHVVGRLLLAERLFTVSKYLLESVCRPHILDLLFLPSPSKILVLRTSTPFSASVLLLDRLERFKRRPCTSPSPFFLSLFQRQSAGLVPRWPCFQFLCSFLVRCPAPYSTRNTAPSLSCVLAHCHLLLFFFLRRLQLYPIGLAQEGRIHKKRRRNNVLGKGSTRQSMQWSNTGRGSSFFEKYLTSFVCDVSLRIPYLSYTLAVHLPNFNVAFQTLSGTSKVW